MKKQILKMYGQDITVYEFSKEDARLNIHGLGDNPEKTFFMRNGELLEGGTREKQMFYGEGHTDEQGFVVLAYDIDQKQLANVFVSLGVTEASYIAMDITGISIEDLEQFQEVAEKLDFEKLTGESVEELKEVVVPEAPKKAPRKRAPKASK